MKASQKLAIRLSEVRSRLNEIGGLSGDDYTEAVKAEERKLQEEYPELETRYRSAVIAEDKEQENRTETVDQETRERRELRSKSKLGNYVRSFLLGTRLDGAEAEYASAEGCEGYVPVNLFEEDREVRAVTEAPADSDVNKSTDPIVPAIFDRSIAGWLGVQMPTAGVGIKSYPVLSTKLTGGMKGESAAAAETAGAFTVTDSDPRRLTGSFRIRKEDIAKLSGMESALRQNLQSVLSDQLDNQLLNGDGAAPNLNGVFQQLTDPTAPEAGVETFPRFVSAFASHVDGLYATTPADVRALVGPHTGRLMIQKFATNDDSVSAYSHLQATFGGIRVSRRIPDPASNVQQAVIRRGNPMGDRVAVAPTWSGLELIRDPYTAAGKGEVVVTGVSLVGGVVLLRKDVFVQDSFRVSA